MKNRSPLFLLNPLLRFRLRRWPASGLLRALCLGGASLLTALLVVMSYDGVLEQAHSQATPDPTSLTQTAPARPPETPDDAFIAPMLRAPTNPKDAPDVKETPKDTADPKDLGAKDPSGEPKKPDSKADAEALGPLSQYVLEFNRSPAMGNRFRLEGTYAESRMGFTRPRNWKLKGAKALVRFQHSPNLVAGRSNLVVRVNDTSVGSVPLNLKDAQIGEAVVVIPPNLIQDYNEITVVAQQENSPTCSKPGDKSLWTEVLPDSKLVFDYYPNAVRLDFSRYPYPMFDELSLDASRVSYLLPSAASDSWLMGVSRFQTNLGRLVDFRPLETQLIKDVKNLVWSDRVVIIGTPEEQPILKTLKLPFPVVGNRLQEGKVPVGDDEGILMLTTLQNGTVPALIATGNSAAAVEKAVQFLTQPQASQIGTGAVIKVPNVADLPNLNPRDWERSLPKDKSFNLRDLRNADHKQILQDITVRGASAPPVEIPFRALPDDRFNRGSSFKLNYSYSAGADPKTSSVSVFIDGIGIGSKKLDSDGGGTRESFTVDLPDNLLKPDSRLQIAFRLTPKDAQDPKKCGQVADQQLWSTVHTDSHFDMQREIGVQLPDLKLLTAGYPFAAPQDLSRLAIVLPDSPTETDVMTLLKFSERMGRISQAKAVKQTVYRNVNFEKASDKTSRNLVVIGTRDRLPLSAEVFASGGKSFQLGDLFGRKSDDTQIQALPDNGGVIKSVISRFKGDRVILALTAQTEAGLKQVQNVLGSDAWFYQLKDDTALFSTTQANPSPYDPNAYQFHFLQQAEQKTLENLNPLNRVRRFLQSNFYLLPIGIIVLSVLMYGIAQLYLKRVSRGS
jgi:cellulose synthase operon protein B